MQVTKLISSKSAIERYLVNIGNTPEINEDDIRMWLAEVYELAGVPSMAISKIIGHKQDSAYEFTNYQVPLPCDFYKLKPGGIAVNGQQVRYSQNSFHYLMDGECCNLDSINAPIDTFSDSFGNEFSPSEGVSVINPGQDITFNIEDGKITFNIKEGTACIAYWSYPVDDEGFPMIPDTAKFKRACADYIRYKSDYILWRQGLIADKIFQYSEGEKQWSLNSAKNELLMPDDYQLSSLQRSIIRLMPIQESIGSFYKNLGVQERGYTRMRY